MKPRVAIVDYGMGNLRSVQKALELAGADARITNSPAAVRSAHGVVLPGVGAFGEAVRRLKAEGLWQTLQQMLASGKPFLGICLGYQLLFDKSEESPGTRGLAFMRGSVRRFRFPKRASKKVPHMGWNTLRMKPDQPHAYLKGIRPDDHFYFVHSYYPVPDDTAWVASTTSYGALFASTVARGPLFACQFHPEKSGRQGQRILKNWLIAC